VEETTQNLGALNADGIDVQLDYTVPIGSDWGRLNVNLLVTHINKWEFQEDVVSPFGQFAGTITTDVAEAFPDYKAVLNLGWDWRKFGVNWNMRYIDGMRVVNDDAVGSPVVNGLAPSVPAYDYHRINLRYSPTDNIDLSVGVDNVFDELPPIYTDDVQAGQQANTDPSTYDILGRRYFAMAQFKF
jgi:outer membrane receptor protein involved in Fe transport